MLKNFKNMCLNEYGLDLANFLTAAGLVWQAYLKESKVEFELLTDIDMLLMVERGIRYNI